jgi:3',5'-cyclic AMP phosphodiesterase CpdA
VPKLFVIMPFGPHRLNQGDPSTEHDFDLVYQDVVVPAAHSADWEVLRIDELYSTGSINDQYLNELYTADLVLADISMPNGNVYYELGIRHAVSPLGTLLIAVSGTKLPFDISSQRVLFYPREPVARASYVEKIATTLRRHGQEVPRNPVREYLERLGLVTSAQRDPAGFEHDLNGKIERARNVEQLVAVWHWARQQAALPASIALTLAEQLANGREFATAVQVLQGVSPAAQDYEVYRQLGFYLQKLGANHDEEVLQAFSRARELNPFDADTLGMIGGFYKRRGKFRLAREAYDAGLRLSPKDLYMRVTQAAMAILEAPTQPEMGVESYRTLLRDIQDDPDKAGDSWASLVASEAAFAIGKDEFAAELFEEAIKLGAKPGDVRSAADQIRFLGQSGFRTTSADQLYTFLDERIVGLEKSYRTASPSRRASSAEDAPKIIFHLSDTHFGSVQRHGVSVNMHRFYDSQTNQRLSAHIATEVNSFLEEKRLAPDQASIVVSGDVTYTATLQEFSMVTEFLREVCGETEIPKDRIFIVPGNHDVDWNAANDLPNRDDCPKRFENYLVFLKDFYGEQLFRSRYPLITWDFTVNGKRPYANEIIAFWLDDDVCYVGFNSCVYETSQDHYGFIGVRQLDNVARWIKASVSADVVRIGVLHHHLHPVPEALEHANPPEVGLDISTIRDAGFVEQRLERFGFDLLLHGHKHKAQVRETFVRNKNTDVTAEEKRLIISGCGSTGVNGQELEHGLPNHYAIIELLRRPRRKGADFAHIEWRELSLELGAEWAPGPRWALRG